MRISDWSSDVCSSDLGGQPGRRRAGRDRLDQVEADAADRVAIDIEEHHCRHAAGKRVVMAAAEPGNAAGMPQIGRAVRKRVDEPAHIVETGAPARQRDRSEEHTSELQSLMRISYAVF